MLNSTNFNEAINELKNWMVENKIPFTFEGDSMFFIDVQELNISDIPILESAGFQKKEVDERENSIHYIWELNS